MARRTNQATAKRASVRVRPERISAAVVIDTASEIADTEGFDAVSLTRVAKELGVTQPGLYRHVDGIHELRRALVLRARELLVADLTEAAIGRTRDEALTLVAAAWRKFSRVHPGLYEATNRVPTLGDDELEASVQRVVTVIAKSMSGYRLAANEQVHAARSLRSALHGFVALERDAGHPPGAQLDESFEQLVLLLVAGVRAMEAAAPLALAPTPRAQPRPARTATRRR